MQSGTASGPAHVVIAGGGFAALEAAVALTALVPERVRLTLISPQPQFRYRPAASAEAFGGDPPLVYDLSELAEGLGAQHRADRLAGVSPKVGAVKLHSGHRVPYDFLILAMGAVSRPVIPGALTFRDQRDVPSLRGLLDQGQRGELRRLVFAVPSARSWSLPAYELALLCRNHLAEVSPTVELAVVSAEHAPLEVFGRETSALVGDLLASREIEFLGGASPRKVSAGTLELEFDAPVPADAVVAVPELRGRRIPGVPASWLGFIPTDGRGRVEGLKNVYAAGDGTSFPVKQGGLAAQQADHVAQAIASTLGAAVHEPHPARVLQGRLLGGSHPLFLRAELDEFGQPSGPTIERFEYGHVPPPAKVLARYLEPFLDRYEATGELKLAG
jgi:sulfide:quinone oxidoreductase